MSYNIVNPTGIEPKTYPLILTAAAVDFMAAMAASTAFQGETISLANVDTVNPYDVTIQLLRSAVAYILLPAITIQPKQTLILPFPYKLETGDKFQGFGSTTLKIHAVIGGKLFT